jgi:anti-sigma regulatory factor (Ser/Thr protein kinase)
LNNAAEQPANRLKLPATLASLEPFQEFVRAQIRPLPCSREIQFKIQLALEEALVNIAHYAYPAGTDGWIEVACRLDAVGRRLRVEIRDAGRAFDPLGYAQPETNVSLEERQVGGLGIFLVRQMTERAEYRREGATNVLTLLFNLAAAP